MVHMPLSSSLPVLRHLPLLGSIYLVLLIRAFVLLTWREPLEPAALEGVRRGGLGQVLTWCTQSKRNGRCYRLGQERVDVDRSCEESTYPLCCRSCLSALRVLICRKFGITPINRVL